MQARKEMFVGRPSEKEKQAWNPLEMIKDGSFVCLNPDADWEATNKKGLFWIVKSFGQVQPAILVDGKETPAFYAQGWRPKSQ
jgi:hypothetical protein